MKSISSSRHILLLNHDLKLMLFQLKDQKSSIEFELRKKKKKKKLYSITEHSRCNKQTSLVD